MTFLNLCPNILIDLEGYQEHEFIDHMSIRKTENKARAGFSSYDGKTEELQNKKI